MAWRSGSVGGGGEWWLGEQLQQQPPQLVVLRAWVVWQWWWTWWRDAIFGAKYSGRKGRIDLLQQRLGLLGFSSYRVLNWCDEGRIRSSMVVLRGVWLLRRKKNESKQKWRKQRCIICIFFKLTCFLSKILNIILICTFFANKVKTALFFCYNL